MIPAVYAAVELSVGILIREVRIEFFFQYAPREGQIFFEYFYEYLVNRHAY